jgi:hypothetical protein
MATALFSTLYDDVMPHAAGVTADMALDAIRKAAIELCKESRIWRYEHPDISVVADQSTYAFVPPDDTKVVEILDAWYENVWLDPMGTDDLARVNTRWQSWTAPRPLYITQLDDDNVRLVPEPTTALASGLHILVALKPTNDATGMEEWILEDWREQIARGALARIYESPRKPYSDSGLARVKKAEFRQDCTDAYNAAMNGLTRSTSRTFTLSRR